MLGSLGCLPISFNQLKISGLQFLHISLSTLDLNPFRRAEFEHHVAYPTWPHCLTWDLQMHQAWLRGLHTVPCQVTDVACDGEEGNAQVKVYGTFHLRLVCYFEGYIIS
jgi:hypothetical protein